MSKREWTTEPPTEPGWYWARNDAIPEREFLIEAKLIGRKKELLIFMGGSFVNEDTWENVGFQHYPVRILTPDEMRYVVPVEVRKTFEGYCNLGCPFLRISSPWNWCFNDWAERHDGCLKPGPGCPRYPVNPVNPVKETKGESDE